MYRRGTTSGEGKPNAASCAAVNAGGKSGSPAARSPPAPINNAPTIHPTFVETENRLVAAAVGQGFDFTIQASSYLHRTRRVSQDDDCDGYVT
jgi:hypothetical protein